MAEARSAADQRLDKRRMITTLETRLEDGHQRIVTAQQEGREVEAWENFWMMLLAEYEDIVAELDPHRWPK